MCGRGPVGYHKHVPQDGINMAAIGSCLFRVRVGSLLAASEGLHNVHKPPDILDPPLSAPSLLFLLLASLDLGGLASELSSTSERSVDLSSLEGDGQVDGLVLQEGEADLILQGGAGAEKVQLLSVNSLKQRELCPERLHVGGGGDIKHMGLFSPYDQLHDDFSCRSESSNKSLV